MKRPAFQWYPGDWRRDTALQSCSIDARGLWVEMINLMHDGEPYGHLTAGGIPISATMLGTLTGVPISRVKRLLAELEDRRIFSRTEPGVIYSRRMVRDEDFREQRKAFGKLGGNPNLIGKTKPPEEPPEDNPDVGAVVNGKVNPNPTPATATATAVAFAVEQVSVIAQALSIRANQGLREHPTRPQPNPRIMPGAGRSVETAEALLTAGVPLPFAEAHVYELARTHSADGDVTSLKYFKDYVLRKWDESQESALALTTPRPASPHKNGRRAKPAGGPKQEYVYPPGTTEEPKWMK